jgi:Ala-tRNA(Pro) deacylase
MAIHDRLRDFLTLKNVRFDIIKHPETFTAQETAHMERVSGKQMAKVVMINADGKNVMAVLPAASQLSFPKFKKLIGAKEMRLASEKEFKALFPDCEVGAMPPFGDLYGLPFFVDLSLAYNSFIIFNAGTHQESIRMSYRDYEKIAEPDLVEFKAES